MAPIISYQDQTVVITGAATGVGAALARLVREAGAARVIGLDIKDCGAGVDESITCDLSDPAAIDAAIVALPERIDALFPNAGVAGTAPMEVAMGVNTLSVARLVTALTPRLVPGGSVTITSSTAGIQYPAHLEAITEFLAISDWQEALTWCREHPEVVTDHYAFSKECSQVLTMQLAPRLLPAGVRVNSVCPGVIQTPLLGDFRESMGGPLLDWMVSQSGGELATAEDVANVLAFLGSRAAHYISGVNLLVDKGFMAAVTTGQADFSALPV